MRKILAFLLILVATSAFAQITTLEVVNLREGVALSSQEDCGRLVEISSGNWAPLNLCADGSIPNAKDCRCPGTRKWNRTSSSIEAPSVLKSSFRQPKTQFAVPVGTDLVKYPILEMGELQKPHRVAELGLHPLILKEAMTSFNYSRKDKRFHYETLPAGTLVFADENGNPIYKADCSNRLAQVVPCPKCPPVSSGGAIAPVKPNPNLGGGGSGDISPKKSAGLWGLLGAALSGAGKGIVAVAKFFWNWLLPLILFIVLLALAGYLLYRLARAIADAIEARRAVPHPAAHGVMAGVAGPVLPIAGGPGVGAPAPVVAPFLVPPPAPHAPAVGAMAGGAGMVPPPPPAAPVVPAMGALAGGGAPVGGGAPAGVAVPAVAVPAPAGVVVPRLIQISGYNNVQFAENGGIITVTVS